MKIARCMTLAAMFLAWFSQAAGASIYDELGRTCSDPQRMSLVLWMPQELFEEMSQMFPDGALEELQETLKGFSMVAAVDGRVTPLGRIVYRSDATIRQDLAIVKDGRRYRPIPADEAPEGLRFLQQMMQQAWASMMGELGSNMRLYLFPVELDAAAQGEFFVRLGGTDSKEELFRYETPLRGVVPDSPCAGCDYPVRAAWNFCPRCGQEKRRGEADHERRVP